MKYEIVFYGDIKPDLENVTVEERTKECKYILPKYVYKNLSTNERKPNYQKSFPGEEEYTKYTEKIIESLNSALTHYKNVFLGKDGNISYTLIIRRYFIEVNTLEDIQKLIEKYTVITIGKDYISVHEFSDEENEG